MRSWAVAPGVVAMALAMCGCESNEQRSAQLEKQAHHVSLAQQGVSVTHASRAVKVLQSTVLRGSEANAVVVMLRNDSPSALRDAPIQITVRDAKGATLYENNVQGLEGSLTHVALLEPGAETAWVDDQVQLSGTPASVSALVGEGTRAPSRVPQLTISGTHRVEEPSVGVGVGGTVTNRSSVTQQSLVVYAVARRGSRIVAAGRAELSEAAAGAGTSFQAFFIGNPSGAQIQTSAPATTF